MSGYVTYSELVLQALNKSGTPTPSFAIDEDDSSRAVLAGFEGSLASRESAGTSQASWNQTLFLLAVLTAGCGSVGRFSRPPIGVLLLPC